MATTYQKIKRYFRLGVKFGTWNPRKQRNKRVQEKKLRLYKQFRETAGKCAKCGQTENLTIDHIVPTSKGGSRWKKSNWQVLCKRCNELKRDNLP